MRKRWIMSAAGTLTAIALLALTGALAAPTRAATPTNFHVTLTATVTENAGGGCCFRYNLFAGTAVLPRIGPATFSGETFRGIYDQGPFPSLVVHSLHVSALGNNGRTVDLDGGGSGEPMPLPWTATSSLFTGSGEFTVTPDPFQGYLPLGTQLTIDFTGALLPA
jgi:hypothetical protein